MNRTIEEIDLTGLIDDDLDDEYDFPTVKISSRRPAAMPSIVKTSNNHKSKNQPSLRHNLPMKKKLSHTKSRKAVLSKKRPSKLVSKAVPNMISPNVVECIEILDDDDKSSEGSNNSDRHDVKDIVNDMKGENYQRKVSVSQCSMGENMDVEPCLSRDACETDTFENPQQPLIRDGIINKKDKEDKISTSKCDRDDANWNDMLQRLISYHNQNGIWNVSIKDDKILQRWVWDQRKAYRLYHEGKESVLKMEWIKLLDDVNFDWGSSRATSASSISDYLWFKEYEQFLDFFEANGRSKAHKHEQCYCWQTAQKHQYWNRKQGKKSQMTDERIKLLEEVGFNWNLSAHEIISSVVDLTDSDNDNTPKASKIQHGSAIKSKQNIGVWSRSFTSQASESRFVFASHKHYPPKKQIEMKKKKMFNVSMCIHPFKNSLYFSLLDFHIVILVYDV